MLTCQTGLRALLDISFPHVSPPPAAVGSKSRATLPPRQMTKPDSNLSERFLSALVGLTLLSHFCPSCQDKRHPTRRCPHGFQSVLASCAYQPLALGPHEVIRDQCVGLPRIPSHKLVRVSTRKNRLERARCEGSRHSHTSALLGYLLRFPYLLLSFMHTWYA